LSVDINTHNRRRQIILLSGLYLLAVALGVGSALLWLTKVGVSGERVGTWRVNLLAGSRDADVYTRARIALGAVLALNRSETLYYTTDHDDNGVTLRAECHYRVEGLPPPARWWSLTAYDADHFLFPNDLKRYSVSSETVRLDNEGRFSATIGAPTNSSQSDASWIPTSRSGVIHLTLRLYSASEAVQHAPGLLATPSIRRVGACQ